MLVFIIFIIFILLLLLVIIIKKNISQKEYYDKYRQFLLTPIKDFPDEIRDKPRVVVSLSTTPKRLKFIPKIINDIKKQSYQPDVIYINIPYYFKRKKEYYNIPDDWKFDSNVVIVRCDDYGPATKLLGCIDYEKDDETMIITIDDDQLYPTQTFFNLVTYSLMYPNFCISNSGQIGCNKYIKDELHNYNIINPFLRFLEGFNGALYRRKYVTQDMINYFKNMNDKNCFVSDDMTISTWVLMNNSKIMRTSNGIITSTIEEIDVFDPLHKEDRLGVYENCCKKMDQLQFLRKYIWVKSYNYICDKYEPFEHYILADNDLKMNKNLPDLLKLDKTNYENIVNGDIVCIRTYQLKDFINVVFKKLDDNIKIILVTINSDSIVPNDIWKDKYTNSKLINLEKNSAEYNKSPDINFDDFVNDNRLIHWFCQNLNGEYLCDKLTHLPIGIDYHTQYFKNMDHPYYQEKQLEYNVKKSHSLLNKNMLVYANFQHNNTSTRFKNVYAEDRNDIYNKLRNNSLVYFEPQKTNQYTFWNKIINYLFIISPLGNGLDCHRTWEALILGCIPIVKTSVLDKIYDELPVVIVNDWNDITLDNLIKWKKWVLDNKTKFNYDKLTTDYWKKEFYSYK